jgi:pyridoxine kinase
MATIIAVSSFVARGSVGLRAVVPALERMGHDVIACPTVLLSNHLGHAHTGGGPVSPETLSAMFEVLDENGWLSQVSAVLTGFFPSAEHVRLTEALIDRVRALRPDALIVCDPVLGDRPEGLYVPQAVAEAVRDRLMPKATHIKPNLFELAFLSGQPVETMDFESLDDVVQAARSLSVPVVLASSVPISGNRLANVLVTREEAGFCAVPIEAEVPHGTGDLLMALFVAQTLNDPQDDALTRAASAVAGVASVIALSRGSDELNLSGLSPWHTAPPLAVERLDQRES